MRRFEWIHDYTSITEEDGQLPQRSTLYSAGYDIRMNDARKAVIVKPGKTEIIHTGICAQMNQEEALLIYARSGIAIKQGLRPSNCTGVIDADYYPREILIGLYNDSDVATMVKNGDRIAQGIFTAFLITEDDEQHEKSVRDGGLGHSKG